ncbi:hypothetical protein F1188_19575 [Roseospira marina]|uniref:Uncharacterized protein n=1 Tax=Roseospira marina TaxID=140057 RepID=A0A5M6I717_9PROT|nr:hypothetical protein [Roseospira marina]KAA5603509.1 hypothetical protein F1188_19575 [Roseospira marina]MBB4315063.1 glutamate synthase domain-containing protein 3 [Roseospira marina]MBB5088167.1 glutamate synthase domain-containing protein 3 [Roseospira marina]
MDTIDLDIVPLRDLNARLHDPAEVARITDWRITNSKGRHNIAVGLDAPVTVSIAGHVGYYCAGMNEQATVEVHGNAGVGLAENMMSGRVVVHGNASQAAGATAHGGLLVIHGDAAGRCGISLKGADIVVKGSVGHMTAFMAQAGRLVVCGDAGDGLGDSLYEAVIYVAGSVHGLGADCVEQPMEDADRAAVAELLATAGIDDIDPSRFRRYGSARELYTFKIENVGAY